MVRVNNLGLGLHNPKEQPVSSLTDGTSAPTRTWLSPEFRSEEPTAWQRCSSEVPAVTSQHRPALIRPRGSKFLPTAIRWNVRAFIKRTGSTFAFFQENPLRDCHLPTQQTSSRNTKNYSRACYLRLNNVSDVRRKKCVPCWNKESETLYRFFVRAPVGTDSDKAASSLLSWIDQKRQERREEAINSIDFSHSSRKAWNSINKLSSRSGHSSRLCPVSASFIALQLMKNESHKTENREFTRPINKELSNLQKILAPSRQRSLLPPSSTWSQQNIQI